MTIVTRNRAARRAAAQASQSAHMSPNIIETDATSAGTTSRVTPLPRLAPSSAVELLGQLHERAPRKVEFNQRWANGTGYLNGAIYDEQLAASMQMGEAVAFVDDFGRKAVLFKLPLGQIVLFERYIESAGPVVCNHDFQIDSRVLDLSSALEIDAVRGVALLAQLAQLQTK